MVPIYWQENFFLIGEIFGEFFYWGKNLNTCSVMVVMREREIREGLMAVKGNTLQPCGEVYGGVAPSMAWLLEIWPCLMAVSSEVTLQGGSTRVFLWFL